MEKKNKRRIRNFFINGEIQTSFVLTNFLYMTFVIVLTLGVMEFPTIYKLFRSSDMSTRYRAAQAIVFLSEGFITLIPGLVTFMLLYFIQQILITHRFCGPLVNFRHTFHSVKEGDLTRKIHLRKSDFLKKEGACIREMIEGMGNIVSRVKSLQKSLESAAEKTLRSADAAGSSPELADNIAALRNTVAEMGTALDRIRLDRDGSPQ